MGHRILYIPKPGNQIYYPEYGSLYNWYAATDVREIANTGWSVPTLSEFQTLSTYLGGNSVSGAKLKENSNIYWSFGYVATNISNFNLRGAGRRYDGDSYIFSGLQNVTALWTTTILSGNRARILYVESMWEGVDLSYYGYYPTAYSIRLIKSTTTLSHGETGTYTGNDGKVYRTICIGTQEWLADNLSETRFRDGSNIPWYGADPANYFTNAEWAALTTAGCCAYNNTLSNVGPGFSFPT